MSDKNQQEQLEDLIKKLNARGVKLGEWGETKEGTIRHPLFEKQVSLYKKLKKVLEAQVVKDQRKLVELQEVLDKLKHGGGQ